MDNLLYNGMDKILEKINSKHISLPREDELRNNKILLQVLEIIVTKMRRKDTLFNKLYKNMYFGGSYYDGLKVGSPDEYDIDLLLKFPPASETEMCNINQVEICTSNKPGFVNLYLHKRNGFEKLCEYWQAYLDIERVLPWIQGVLQKALNDFDKNGLWYILENIDGQQYYVKFRTGGPAFTLCINRELHEKTIMNVDLVPCFSFSGDKWPKNGFKPNPFSTCTDLSDFFLVPKRPKGVKNYGGRYWRLSFQAQEIRLIHGKERLKPALKLLKKMRDVMNQKQISSYFLKTIVLWETDKNLSIWRDYSLSYIFMHILKKYQECLNDKKIPYFWYKKYNLLETVEGDLNNISRGLDRIIKDIDRNMPHNPAVIVKYLLTPYEQSELFPELVVQEPSSWCTLL